ncbi:MAG: GerMN domain-containing protein, partial [Lachnospiraceae bacterium]|nr:GerMN domain-containing protein [Lachnospiraceae bacterium]
VDEEYLKLSATTEVLVRAAIVRTLLQADGISRMQITVAGNQLVDAAGDPVGWMTAEQFIHNDGSEINTYEKVRVKLYFANEAGDHLIAAYREKFYSTNTPLERFVVDEILSGPSGTIAGLYPSVNGDSKILSVMTKDGICYVNFDAKFLELTGNVSMEVAIYSIVNSLSELQNIHHVQILVNGSIPDVFPQAVFEKNMDIVTLLEQNQEQSGQ